MLVLVVREKGIGMMHEAGSVAIDAKEVVYYNNCKSPIRLLQNRMVGKYSEIPSNFFSFPSLNKLQKLALAQKAQSFRFEEIVQRLDGAYQRFFKKIEARSH